MATITRVPKAGKDWNVSDLRAFNIAVEYQTEEEFFALPLPDVSDTLHDFIRNQDPTIDMDTQTIALLKRLHLLKHMRGAEESGVTDFVAEFLRVLGFETFQTVVRTRKDIQLYMCGTYQMSQNDVCVLSSATSSNPRHLLLIQEYKFQLSDDCHDDGPLIAGAIAALQAHNHVRSYMPDVPLLERQIIPAICFHWTYPSFYKIEVTTQLAKCVSLGTYPLDRTVVYKFRPQVQDLEAGGMWRLENREKLIQYFMAFKEFAHLCDIGSPSQADYYDDDSEE